MRKIDVLCWGVEHIAENHNFNASIEDVTDGNVCIFGGCNVPTLSDVRMLCSDLSIPNECIEISDFGIDIWLTQEWYEEHGKKDYEPTGLEMWKRHGCIIGM